MAFNTSDDDSQQRFALGIIFALVILVVSTVVGSVVYRSVVSGKGAPTAPTLVLVVDPAVASQGVPPSLAPGAVQQGDGAYIRVEEGVVKFYFASSSAELATGADEALADVVRIAAQRSKKLAVSGFHDATGDAALNAELAKRRAQAVQQAIIAQGVAAANVELRKPEVTQANGSNDEARRVEVVIIE